MLRCAAKAHGLKEGETFLVEVKPGYFERVSFTDRGQSLRRPCRVRLEGGTRSEALRASPVSYLQTPDALIDSNVFFALSPTALKIYWLACRKHQKFWTAKKKLVIFGLSKAESHRPRDRSQPCGAGPARAAGGRDHSSDPGRIPRRQSKARKWSASTAWPFSTKAVAMLSRSLTLWMSGKEILANAKELHTETPGPRNRAMSGPRNRANPLIPGPRNRYN